MPRHISHPRRDPLDAVYGRALRRDVPHTLGSPERPLSREQHLAKFRRCWSCGARPLADEAAERLIHLVDGLEELGNCNEIAALTLSDAC